MEISYQLPWNGTRIEGKYLAIDTETEFLGHDRREVQKLVLASVSNGETTAIIRPDQMHQFMMVHAQAEFVGHNLGSFDFWVIHKHLTEVDGDKKWGEWWMEKAHSGHLHDSMILDQLIRIGKGFDAHRRGLKQVVKEYANMDVNKDDEHRTEFASLIGKEDDWPLLDRGWFDYAALDSFCLYSAWRPMLDMARSVQSKAGLTESILSSIEPQFGILTEKVQVGAAIALAKAGAYGFAIDSGAVQTVEAKLQQQAEEEVKWITLNRPGLLTFVGGLGSAQKVKTLSSGVPTLNRKPLIAELEQVELDRGLTMSRTEKTNQITTALEDWRVVASNHPLIEHWGNLVDISKTLQFVQQLKNDKPKPASLFEEAQEYRGEYRDAVRPHYETLVRTGRTSAREPNLQQMPREAWFRSMFVARSGRVLVVADYSAIELVTLAAVCLKRYGTSRLAEVITEGRDPHAYTAASLMGLDPDEWDDFAKRDKVAAKKMRQNAKPVNFGVPGGMFDKALSAYAQANYGVTMSVEDAGKWRTKLITEVYPELEQYLTDSPVGIMARNLGVIPSKVWSLYGMDANNDSSWFPVVLKKVLSGNVYKKDGSRYDAGFIRKIWQATGRLVKDSTLSAKWKEMVAAREGSQTLVARLWRESAVTLTGRVRGGVSYTEARNTPFQGLAADGSKIALWNLLREGPGEIVAFIHDEVVVEVPEQDAELSEREVKRIMMYSMTEAIQTPITIGVATEVTKKWEKP